MLCLCEPGMGRQLESFEPFELNLHKRQSAGCFYHLCTIRGYCSGSDPRFRWRPDGVFRAALLWAIEAPHGKDQDSNP